MYLSKESLKNLFSNMRVLFPTKDGTQLCSCIRYFFALDEFKKKEEHPCNSENDADRKSFIKYVGNVVRLSPLQSKQALYTTNFKKIANSDNYATTNNLFSSSQVRMSKNSQKPEPYPSNKRNATNKSPLFICSNGVIDFASDGYKNFVADYLKNSDRNFALLFLWLNRYTEFSTKKSVYKEFVENLAEHYSAKMFTTLHWKSQNVKKLIEDFIVDVSTSDKCSYLDNNDAISDEAFQMILYGVPGCGKSWKIKERLKDVDEYCKIRTVFHPEYTNADFVGQILPRIKENDREGSTVEYEFVPGPFSKILRRAYLNPDETFYLIIEEINRGNAAAIFGEIFQLLDRIASEKDKDKSTENTYGEGWSSYGVDNRDVNAYIRNKMLLDLDRKQNEGYYLVGDVLTLNEPKNNNDGKKTNEPPKFDYYESIDVKTDNVKWKGKDVLHFSANTAIRLPPNLFILATMNTSDQNVFTLDNAFQRRFKMEMVRNELTNDQYKIEIGDTGVLWGDFWEWINEKINSPEYNISKSVDKSLGGWFIVGQKNVKFSKDEFAEKVLKYLWDDVFKRNSAKNIFKQETLEELVKVFEKKYDQGKGFDAFKNTFNGVEKKEDIKGKSSSEESNS